MEVSKELIKAVLNENITEYEYINHADVVISIHQNNLIAILDNSRYTSQCSIRKELFSINIYEFMHKNLKEWAKSHNFYDKIDWSDGHQGILTKAEELRNEIN